MNSKGLLAKIFLTLGIVGPLLFIVIFLIEGSARSDGYDPMRHPISSLAIGEWGWVQIVNFLMVSLSVASAAIGIFLVRQKSKTLPWVSLLLIVASIGLFGAGLFVSDAVFGYPVTEPLMLQQFSDHGHLHDAFSVWFFRGVPFAAFVACYYFARQKNKMLSIYSFVSGLGMIVVVILAGLGFARINTVFTPVGGLLQRTAIIIGLVWVALVAYYFKYLSTPVQRITIFRSKLSSRSST